MRMNQAGRRFVILSGMAAAIAGCGDSRVHITADVHRIKRVAIINLADAQGRPSPESEFFTNEFVSLGFSVVERGHLQDVIKEAFTSSGYLDERSVAKWGRGLGIEAVVLHQILANIATGDDRDRHDVSGWVRMVDVETGMILLTYNTQVEAGTTSRSKAAKEYAERVVDDIARAMRANRIEPGSLPAPRPVKFEKNVEATTTSETASPT